MAYLFTHNRYTAFLPALHLWLIVLDLFTEFDFNSIYMFVEYMNLWHFISVDIIWMMFERSVQKWKREVQRIRVNEIKKYRMPFMCSIIVYSVSLQNLQFYLKWSMLRVWNAKRFCEWNGTKIQCMEKGGSVERIGCDEIKRLHSSLIDSDLYRWYYMLLNLFDHHQVRYVCVWSWWQWEMCNKMISAQC